MAGRAILDHLNKGEKPASGEIADEVGMNSAMLGWLLTKIRDPTTKEHDTGRG